MPQKPQSFIDDRMSRIIKDSGRYETMTSAQRCRFIKRVRDTFCHTNDTHYMRILTNILKDAGELDQQSAPTFTNVQSICLYWRYNQKDLSDTDIDILESKIEHMLNDLESVEGYKDSANISRLKRTQRSIASHRRAMTLFRRFRLDTSSQVT